MNRTVRVLLLASSLFAISGAALTQTTGPQPSETPSAAPAPSDAPYAGAIQLVVDATDLERRIFSVRETIPAAAGTSLVLLYPEWLPGHHSPAGAIELLAGLTIQAGGKRVPWTRDPIDVFAFHVQTPVDANELNLEFQFVSPVASDQGRVIATPDMLNLQWNSVLLYPAGYFARQIRFEPAVRLPEGWQFASALETASTAGGLTAFKAVSLNTLVDSPLFAGRYFERFELDGDGRAPVRLNVIADRPALLKAQESQLAVHRALVQQAYKLFGSRHYDHYDFLLALTDRMGGIGLEHHQSSENATTPGYFTEWDKNAGGRDLLSHEYTHSWNGKFRRPADLWTPNFNVPMRDSLLWVYEGQTEYWGAVLAARSGLWSRQQALDELAMIAATYDARVGREWRPLEDTTNDPIVAMRRPLPWRSWQRREDYYDEGLLIWLDADTLIRELSGGRRSLDDFAKEFFGVNDGSSTTVTYTFEDIVKALNAVQPHDWATFLRERLQSTPANAPLDGIRRGGYRLVYTDAPSDEFKASEEARKVADLTYSLGLAAAADGRVSDVLWRGPAFQKGLTLGNQLVAVGGIAYSPDVLKDAVRDAKSDGKPIELLVKNGDRYRTVTIDYREGLRYPRLERDASAPARLDDILTAR